MKPKALFWIGLVGLATASGWWWYSSRPLKTSPAGGLSSDEEKLKPAGDRRVNAAVTPESGKRALADMVASGKLSPAVGKAVDAALNIRERYAAAENLPVSLANDDLLALRRFLLQPDEKDKSHLGVALKNTIMDQLCEANIAGLRELLAEIFSDKALDVIVRDYALQHLIEYQQRLGEAGGDRESPAERQQTAEMLWQAMEETDHSIAGTALLGLSRLSGAQPEYDRARVAAAANQLAGDSAVAEVSRLTAIQACAQLGVADALPTIWQMARSGESLPLQISAIGALGVYGDPGSKAFLTEVLNGSQERLKPAAQQALRRITLRERQRAK